MNSTQSWLTPSPPKHLQRSSLLPLLPSKKETHISLKHLCWETFLNHYAYFPGFPYWYFCHQTTSPFWSGKWVVPFSFTYRFLRYSTFLPLDFRESKRSHFEFPKIKSWSTSPFLSSRSLKPTQIVLLKLSTQMESFGQVGGSSQTRSLSQNLTNFS